MVLKKTSSNIKKNNSMQNEKNDPTIFIPFKKDIIEKKATEIAHKGYTWEKLNWLVGENEMRFTNAIEGSVDLHQNSISSEIRINPIRLNLNPNHEETKKIAEFISNQHLSISELCWDLAVREYIVQILNDRYFNKFI